MNFLKAKWKNLALLNYEIDREVRKYIPTKTEIDIWNALKLINLKT